ncbi:hypothetical protein [Tsukamurella spumae]|uniref:DUF1648 domain-containing protein n=1 Tax=Tsukamurella spumae TaxID=44753 RepID=A0A846WXI7_9ACTN|nr:hypothetical protein [Tsukamurella spumae]NKY17868.1 hypothetical protein [Tsukamurella spumae]
MRARQWIYVVAVLACAAALAWAATSGPDPFPTHMGLGGGVDGWRPRKSALLELALVTGGLAVLFACLSFFAPRLPASLVNTPRRDYWLTDAHRPAFSRIIADFFLLIGSLVLFLSAAFTALSVIDAHESAARSALLVLFLLAIAASVIHLVWTLSHPPRSASGRRRPAPSSGVREPRRP